jgi:hypothetical protein
MPAGYSKRTLSEKLGIKPGLTITALNAPPEYRSLLGTLPPGAKLEDRLPKSTTFIHQFSSRRSELDAAFPRLAKALADDGTLWISWPKQSGGLASDLNENVVRDIGLQHGLVDVKVCAVDDVWSGLKFVRRVENRKKV